jgi:hypothetical protein
VTNKRKPAAQMPQVAEVDGRQYAVMTEWDVIGGRLEPVSVTIKPFSEPPHPVLADAIRRLPLGAMQRIRRAEMVERGQFAQRVLDGKQKLTDDPGIAYINDLPFMKALVEREAELARAGSHRGVATSPEELEEVARVYKKAWGRGAPVTKAVANHFGISTSTAGKRIMRAREAGLLNDIRRITR